MKGHSLIELLISLFIVSLVMTVLVEFYFDCQRSYFNAQKQLGETSDILMLSELMRDSARQAGFTPCMGIKHLISEDTRRGKRNLQPLELTKKSFKVQRMSEYFVLAKPLEANRLLLTQSFPSPLKSPVLIADCYYAEVHQVLSTRNTFQGEELILKQALKHQYTAPVYVGEWLEERFLMAKNSKGESGLFIEIPRKEQLSAFVNALSVEVALIQGHYLMKILLYLDKEKQVLVEAAVRSP